MDDSIRFFFGIFSTLDLFSLIFTDWDPSLGMKKHHENYIKQIQVFHASESSGRAPRIDLKKGHFPQKINRWKLKMTSLKKEKRLIPSLDFLGSMKIFQGVVVMGIQKPAGIGMKTY